MNKPPASAGRKAAPIIAVLAAAVLGAIAIAVLTGGKDEPPSTAGGAAAEVRPVQVIGTALPKVPKDAAAVDPALGTKPPELSGRTFAGDAVSIVPGSKARLVVFVAHWCPHCQREVPRLVEWMASGAKPAALDVVAVSTAVDAGADNYPPSVWLAREGFAVPTLADDADLSAAKAWGLPGYPYLVLLKADGTVAARTSGELEVADLDAWVKKGLGLG